MSFTHISGFPELLPHEFALERRWRSSVQEVFESFGYVPIETSAVERLDLLLGKGGDTDKELYGLIRAADAASGPSRLGLHYDLTVPLARYIATNSNELVFPFKRQQIQKAWRGERPQEGRYREFLQCDIDVVERGNLSPDYESEVAIAILSALEQIGVTRLNFAINDRRVLNAAYRAIGIDDTVPVMRILDKLDKTPKEIIRNDLLQQANISQLQADKCLEIAEIKSSDRSFIDDLHSIGIKSDDLAGPLDSLYCALERMKRHKCDDARVYVDMSIARGFDYYTGLVFEGRFQDFPGYPAICSGGRYDNLVESIGSGAMPGVGGSIGLTRILMKMLKEGQLAGALEANSADVLVARFDDVQLADLDAAAMVLRRRGLRTEIFPSSAKLKKQMQYAEKKGIRYVLLPSNLSPSKPGLYEMKDLRSGLQSVVDLENWSASLKP